MISFDSVFSAKVKTEKTDPQHSAEEIRKRANYRYAISAWMNELV